MSNVAIKVQNLTKTYKLYSQPIDRLKESLHPLKKKYHKEFHALKEVSFEIKKGETVGIIGRNGSGKSTLLKVITGVLTPTHGRVHVDGKISAILELGAGFNGEMTGLENIHLNSTINGMSKTDINARKNDIINFSELGDFIHQPVKTYSSGMKARLAFGVAIHVNPDILIVDEALSVGDAAFQRKCFAKMEEIRKNGATILFVSHSEGSIVSLCSRAIWISNGNQIIDGTPKLVTGLYMKHSNEKKIDKSKIEKEYEALVNNKEKKQPQEEKPKEQNNSTVKKTSIQEFFDPALKPKSTIYYEEKGAKISDVKITTLDGKEVNVLTQNKEYILSYKVYMEDINSNILLAMLIKDVKGVNYGGGHYPRRYKYMKIDKNEFIINWKWNCSLTNGQYFINCGISNEQIGFMYRIIDAITFKVVENNKDINSFGPVDFKIKVGYE